MAQLLLKLNDGNLKKSDRSYFIRKPLTIVGSEATHDLMIPTEFSGVAFTLTLSHEGTVTLSPSRGKLNLNGSTLSKPVVLQSCDRIEWSHGAAVFLESDSVSTSAPKSGLDSLAVLQNLSSLLQSRGSVAAAFSQLLDALVTLGGAETGILLSESSDRSGWQVVASRENTSESFSTVEFPSSTAKRDLISNTILREAIETRKPVYVENLIGHPYSDAASVISARLFSVACFPLVMNDAVSGAVFLMTRSPGKSIHRDRLSELNLLATQVALILSSRRETESIQQENRKLRTLVEEFPSSLVYAAGSPLEEVLRKIQKLAPTALNLLVLGETGTGKELVAREIHQKSTVKKGPFVPLNCAAIPATLLESTLFGFERGAFTGAQRAQKGKFQEADGGTLFLDEIGDMPLELQSKLLRVLQDQVVEPIGGRAVPVRVRVIAATHQALETHVKSGHFRQDLWFRLNGATLALPPLRERRQDIDALCAHFLKGTVSLSSSAQAALKTHTWPGNVRELEQVLMRASVLCEGAVIEASDLELGNTAVTNEMSPIFSGRKIDAMNLEEAQLWFTQQVVQKALDRSQGNRALASQELGISERTLYRLLEKSQSL